MRAHLSIDMCTWAHTYLSIGIWTCFYMYMYVNWFKHVYTEYVHASTLCMYKWGSWTFVDMHPSPPPHTHTLYGNCVCESTHTSEVYMCNWYLKCRKRGGGRASRHSTSNSLTANITSTSQYHALLYTTFMHYSSELMITNLFTVKIHAFLELWRKIALSCPSTF